MSRELYIGLLRHLAKEAQFKADELQRRAASAKVGSNDRKVLQRYAIAEQKLADGYRKELKVTKRNGPKVSN